MAGKPSQTRRPDKPDAELNAATAPAPCCELSRSERLTRSTVQALQAGSIDLDQSLRDHACKISPILIDKQHPIEACCPER